MAAYAYRQLEKPCFVETVQAHAGIDIGDTFIGMHLRRVAVPVRPSIRNIGASSRDNGLYATKAHWRYRAVYYADETDITAIKQPHACEIVKP